MKIPRTIKICGHKVRVKTVKNFRPPFDEALGYSDLTHNLIVLRTEFNGISLEDSTRKEVFLHEIIHFISELYGISLNETKVRQLGAGFYQVLIDNKLNFLEE